MTNLESTLWTIDDVAQFLRVKPSVVKFWIRESYIPYIKLGRNIRFDKKDIREWVDSLKQAKLILQENNIGIIN